MGVFRAVVAISIGVAIGTGGAVAVTKSTITARPGDSIVVPSRGIACGVMAKPAGVVCALNTARGLPRGSYSAFVSQGKILVVLNSKPHSRIVFSAKQPGAK